MDFSWGFQSFLSSGTCSRVLRMPTASRSSSASKSSVSVMASSDAGLDAAHGMRDDYSKPRDRGTPIFGPFKNHQSHHNLTLPKIRHAKILAFRDESQVRAVASPSRSVHHDDAFDAAAAYGAEPVIASEHDAVYFRTVISLGFVVAAFESAHFVSVPGLAKELFLALLLFIE